MQALTYHGRRDVRVETVPDPVLAQDDDLIPVSYTHLRAHET